MAITPRCIANGTQDTGGTCALISLEADIKSVSGKNEGFFALHYRLKGASAWTMAAADVALSSDTLVNFIAGKGTFAQASAYEMQVTISDAFGEIAPQTGVLRTAACFMGRLPGKNQLGLFGYVPQDKPQMSMYVPSDGHYYQGDVDLKQAIDGKISGFGNKLLNKVYPVGSIYMSVSATSPSALFGGTWAVWGAVRVSVGVNASDTDFKAAEKTGGAKTHTLTVAELAAHQHSQAAHTHPWLKTVSSGNETYEHLYISTTASNRHTTSGSGPRIDSGCSGVGDAQPAIGSTGGGQAHNNLQPYEDEQAKLRERNGELMVLITAEQEASDGVSQFVSLVRQFTDIPSLTPEIVAAFIEKVYVHDAVVVNRKKQQEIRVVYNFVGDMK